VRLREPINWQETSEQLSDRSIYRTRYSPPTAFDEDAMKQEQCRAKHPPYCIATHALTQVFSMVLRLSDGMLTSSNGHCGGFTAIPRRFHAPLPPIPKASAFVSCQSHIIRGQVARSHTFTMFKTLYTYMLSSHSLYPLQHD